MAHKLAVIAVGGNSLIQDKAHTDIEHQWDTVRQTCNQIAELVADHWRVVITHGNGPQVGHALSRHELAARSGLPSLPMDILVAETQASIGYMIQQALTNALRRMGLARTTMTVVTQVRVNADDPALNQPSKPVGDFMTQEEAQKKMAQGWQVMEDAGRGWRRIVPSPEPIEIIELRAIRHLLDQRYVVIAAGGGGIPVIRNTKGSLRGIEAVIDKDRASGLLAQQLGADLLLISTAVEKLALHFKTPEQVNLNRITHLEAEQYMSEGHFARGSMQPKVEAIIRYIREGGPKAIITNPENLVSALHGQAGTTIIPA